MSEEGVTPKSALKTTSCPGSSSRNESKKKRKKPKVTFGNIDVYYFHRAQGYSSVPSSGGYPLGMRKKHFHKRSFSLEEYLSSKKKNQLDILEKNINEKKVDISPVGLRDLNQSDVMLFDEEERINMLMNAGVKLDHQDKVECQIIMDSRKKNGCDCEDRCDKSTCTCWNSGINCQSDRYRHPCGCTESGCENPYGRTVFNFDEVKTHFFDIMAKSKLDEMNEKSTSTTINKKVRDTAGNKIKIQKTSFNKSDNTIK